MKPIILQVPNRDANSAKMIRPGQAMFSRLQNAPDSDRFTLLIRRFWVRIPGGAPSKRQFPELRPEGISHKHPINRFNGNLERCEIPVHAFHGGPLEPAVSSGYRVLTGTMKGSKRLLRGRGKSAFYELRVSTGKDAVTGKYAYTSRTWPG